MTARVRGVVAFGRQVISKFLRDDCPTQAAALAYYTVFALAPLLVLVMVIAGVFLPQETIGAAIEAQSTALVGPQASDQILTMVEQVRAHPGGSAIARILGALILIYGATGVVNQLQSALDRVWGTGDNADDALPHKKHRSFIARRLFSFGLILGIAFLLLVSLVVSSLVSGVSAGAVALLPDDVSKVALQIVDNGLSFLVVTVLFTAMYELLPEVRVPWRDAVKGGLVTALLFTLGKALIGLYLGNSNIGTAFGAASSLAIVLVWVYYSSVIVLLGAELTHVIAERHAERLAKRDVEPTAAVADVGPKDPLSKPIKRRRRWGRWVLGGLGVVVVALVALRLALPSIVKRYVNRKLDENPTYSGQVGDIDIALYRGAYTIHGIEVRKRTGNVPEPLFQADLVDLSTSWRDLFHGKLVAEIEVDNGKINFVNGGDAESSQTGAETPASDWRDTVRSLFPTRIDRLVFVDGEIHYVDRTASPAIDVAVTDLQSEMLNLTNSEKATGLASTVHATGTVEGAGAMTLQMRFDPFADRPTFDSNLRVDKVVLTRFNKLFQRYGKFDLSAGTVDVNAELASDGGKLAGYVKPVLHDVKVLGSDEQHDPLGLAWELVIGAAKGLLTNDRHDQLATKIPIEGDMSDPKIGTWPAVEEMLRNAFIEALFNGLDNTVDLTDAQEEAAGIDKGDKATERKRRRAERRARAND
jgi:YihY family inner membrane protein